MEYRAHTPDPMAYSLVRNASGGGSDTPSSRFRLMLGAFCQLILVMSTFVALMTGLLLLSESGEDMRGHGVNTYNAAVEHWNTESRGGFAAAYPITLGPISLNADVKDSVAQSFLASYDTDPDELQKPEPLQYVGSLAFASELSGDDWAPGDPSNPAVQVELSVSGNQMPTVMVPRRFAEHQCEWVQRGKWNRQVCKWYYYVLEGICVKIGDSGGSWKPSLELGSLTGSTAGVGCYMYGRPGTHIIRSTNLWGAGVYKKAEERMDAPKTVSVQVKSNADPALIVDSLTQGSYDFGPSQTTKFIWGLILTIGASVILYVMCFCLFIQYTWPQANNNNDRVKYFYRRYLRKPHLWCQRTWYRLTASDNDAHWDDAQPSPRDDDSNWTGPTSGGYTLGQAPPTLHDPNASSA